MTSRQLIVNVKVVCRAHGLVRHIFEVFGPREITVTPPRAIEPMRNMTQNAGCSVANMWVCAATVTQVR